MSGSRAVERWFAALAVVGFVVPNAFVAVFAVRHGADVGAYFHEWFRSVPGTQLTVDLGLTCLAFLSWAFLDARKRGITRWWVTLPATGLVGICFAVPLYLWMRERARTV